MKLYQNNPRRISKKRLAELQAGLDELGDVSGIVHDLNSDQVIGGNQRMTVFDVTKMTPIITEQFDKPTKQGTIAWGYVEWHGERFTYRAVRWTEEQCQRGNIKANVAAGVWNWDVLAGWPDLDKLGFDAETLATWNSDAANLATMLEVPPDFSPVSVDEQGRLDQKSPITCPLCGGEFVPE